MRRNRPKSGQNNPFGMAPGMTPPSFNEADLEAELLALTGESKPKPAAPRAKPPTMPGNLPFSWDEINKQVNTALDENADIEFDEDELMGELDEICSDNETEDVEIKLTSVLDFHKGEALKFKKSGDVGRAKFHFEIMKEVKSLVDGGDFTGVTDQTIDGFNSRKYVPVAAPAAAPSTSTPSAALASTPQSNANQPWTPEFKQPPPTTKDLATALTYRIQKIKYDVNLAEGAAKRRKARLLKSHEDCLKKLKLNKLNQSDLNALPNLDGYPLPGEIDKSAEIQNIANGGEPVVKDEVASTPVQPRRPVPQPVAQPTPSQTLSPPTGNLIDLNSSSDSVSRQNLPKTPSLSPHVSSTSLGASKSVGEQISNQYNKFILEAKLKKEQGDIASAKIAFGKAKTLDDMRKRYSQNPNSVSQTEFGQFGIGGGSAVSPPVQKPLPAAPSAGGQKWKPESNDPPPATNSLVEALNFQRMMYQHKEKQAAAAGEGAKARRHKRNFQTVEKMWKQAKSGIQISQTSLDGLPLIQGWPPLPKSGAGPTPGPSQSSTSQPGPSTPIQPATQTPSPANKPQPPVRSPSNNSQLAQDIISNVSKQQLANRLPGDINKYESTCQILKTRTLEFKQAASLTKDTDKNQALKYMREAKKLEEFHKLATEGKRVDLQQIPETPAIIRARQTAVKDEPGSNLLTRQMSSRDMDLYNRLLAKYENQIKFCQKMSQQFLETNKVQKSAIYDQIKKHSITERDYIHSCMKKGRSPPITHTMMQTIIMAQLNPDLGLNDIRVSLRFSKTNLNLDKFYFIFKVPLHNKADIDTTDKTEMFSDYESVNKAHISKTLNTLHRKSRAVDRAVQQRSVSVELWEKGGFMRSDKKVATSSHPMKDLVGKCTVDVPGQFVAEGRKIVGNATVRIEISKPMKSSEEKSVPMEFTCLEQHLDRFNQYFMVDNQGKFSGVGTNVRQTGSKASSSNSSLKASNTAPAGNKMPPIRSKKVILIENQINQTQIKYYKDQNKPVPNHYTTLDTKLKKEYQLVDKWLQKSQDNPTYLAHYIKCVRESLDTYAAEYESLLSLGARDIETKKAQKRLEAVKLELQELGQSSYV